MKPLQECANQLHRFFFLFFFLPGPNAHVSNRVGDPEDVRAPRSGARVRVLGAEVAVQHVQKALGLLWGGTKKGMREEWVKWPD